MQEAQTFGGLFEDWYARYAKPNLARQETDRILLPKCHIEPEFARTRLTELKRARIARFRDKAGSGRHAACLQRSLDARQPRAELGLGPGLVEVNPAARLRSVGKRRPRERVLPKPDIAKFWTRSPPWTP